MRRNTSDGPKQNWALLRNRTRWALRWKFLGLSRFGPDRDAKFAYAKELLKRIRKVPGIANLRIQQAFDYPQINVDVDRSLAGLVGLSQRDVANSLLVTLSGSGQVRPNFWLNTRNGVSYPIAVQIPQYWMNSLSDLVNLPITSATTKSPQLLGQPVIDIYGAVQGRDLGAVSRDLNRVLDEAAKDAPRGTSTCWARPS